METVIEAPDESTGDSSIVKSEDGSIQQDGGCNSPPPNCAICLGRCRNKSFTDSCLHQFCFKCLLTWSRVKTECPLCKQNFKSIIHNVKSNLQYEEYPVEQPQAEERPPNSLDMNEFFNAARRFRYRTTLTLPRRETLAIEQFLMHYPLAALVNNLPPRHPYTRDRSRRSPADFRRTVYRHNLWARPLPDFTGRFRDCSPEFFRYNDSQIHRLIPWLNRELHYLLNENSGHITYVMERILELLRQHPIVSPEFRAAMHCYFGERTDHFLHEFHCFASTPYDITGYDRHVQYQTDARVSALVDEVLSSSDSDRDSDIVLVSSSHPAPAPAPAALPSAPAPGPSHGHAPAPRYPRDRIPQPSASVVPIETISHSDTDSNSSEVVVVGYIKPPHQRTPELVDLLGSDSDVVVQEPDPPSTASPLVRLTLSRARSCRPASLEAHVDSESEDASYTPPPPAPRRRRRRSRDRPMVLSPPPPLTPPPPTPPPPPPPPSSRPLTPPHLPTPTPDTTPYASRLSVTLTFSTNEDTYSDSVDDSSSDSVDDSSSSYELGRRSKPRRKTKKTAKTERRTRRKRKDRKNSEEWRPEREQKYTGKSKNGKGVKSSKVRLEEIPLPPETSFDMAGPSGITQGRTKRGAEGALHRGSRESKRLKSVVRVMKRDSTSSTESKVSVDSSTHGAAPPPSCGSSTRRHFRRASSAYSSRRDSDSSSDDNIPLQLTIAKMEDKTRCN